MVRSFVGGLELIVSLLKSDDREVGIIFSTMKIILTNAKINSILFSFWISNVVILFDSPLLVWI